MWMSNRLREGKRIVGDIFITEPYAGPGNWMGIVVTKTGTKGVPWQPNQQYNQKRVGAWNLPAEIVEPGDGFAYACTRSGNSGTYPNPPHKPPFTQHTTIGVNAPVWSANSRYWPGSKVRPTTANGHYYQMKRYPAWTANTPISPNQIITPGDSNGNLFFAYVQTWLKGRRVRLSTRMQPTSPNGKVFRVKRVTGNLTSFGSTGAQEPNWSLLVQLTDELPDGSVVWQLDQLMTGPNEPPGDNPQYVGWDTRPGGISYDNNIKWRFFVPKTGRTEPNWNTISGSETVDTPNAQVKSDGSVENGFGVVWVESGPDPADSKVSDNECEWTRIDTVPAVAKVLPVGAANGPLLVETMSLTLRLCSKIT